MWVAKRQGSARQEVGEVSVSVSPQEVEVATDRDGRGSLPSLQTIREESRLSHGSDDAETCTVSDVSDVVKSTAGSPSPAAAEGLVGRSGSLLSIRSSNHRLSVVSESSPT